MTDDPEAIAARLTKAQRAAVSNAQRRGSDYEVNATDELCDELVALGLTGEREWIDMLTPLGLAVRTALQNEPGT